jgi:lipoate-protein ligase A
MAVDEAILNASAKGLVPPTLRLYAWSPACLSLGYAQPVRDIDFENLNKHGWHYVRRPTGGRAILHADELTYAVIGQNNDPRLDGGVLESYRRLSKALLSTLRSLDIQADIQELPSGSDQNVVSAPVCFEEPSNYEITVNRKKLVGSAQARRKGAVLQHGTIPLTGDITRITKVLVYQDETQRAAAANRLYDRATTIEISLGKKVSWDRTAQALIHAFEKELNLKLNLENLSDLEIFTAEKLLADKYDTPEWNQRC